uniref:Uncharacterized protein n=1 Tax=Anguilla anguilla TaxID=7936 RepID=A0A0E9WQD5_ANGAN
MQPSGFSQTAVYFQIFNLEQEVPLSLSALLYSGGRAMYSRPNPLAYQSATSPFPGHALIGIAVPLNTQPILHRSFG